MSDSRNDKKEFWVYAEDLAAAMIGPFGTEREALDHIDFCERRGDGAETAVIADEKEIDELLAFVGLRMTPEEDREDMGLLDD